MEQDVGRKGGWKACILTMLRGYFDDFLAAIQV